MKKDIIIISISQKGSGHTDVSTDLVIFSETFLNAKSKPSLSPLQATFLPHKKKNK